MFSDKPKSTPSKYKDGINTENISNQLKIIFSARKKNQILPSLRDMDFHRADFGKTNKGKD